MSVLLAVLAELKPGVDEVVEAFHADFGADGSVKVAGELLFGEFEHRLFKIVVDTLDNEAELLSHFS